MVDASSAFARNVLDKPVRDLDITISYFVEIKGNRSTVFNFTSLLPKNIKGKQETSNISFSQQPYSVFSENGNKYAKWKFSGKNIKLVIKVRFSAKLFQQVLSEKTDVERLLKNERHQFLMREKYLDVGSRRVKNAKKKIKKKNNDIEQVEEILKFVDKNMKSSKASRAMLGASKALEKGKGDCTEFTDVFVALARQFGIPARHVSGYIVTKSTSIGHSWAEVYTRDKGWISVDPLHNALKYGTFEKLQNKYLAFSDIRNDSELDYGMLYSWNVKNGTGARVMVRVKAVEKK